MQNLKNMKGKILIKMCDKKVQYFRKRYTFKVLKLAKFCPFIF